MRDFGGFLLGLFWRSRLSYLIRSGSGGFLPACFLLLLRALLLMLFLGLAQIRLGQRAGISSLHRQFERLQRHLHIHIQILCVSTHEEPEVYLAELRMTDKRIVLEALDHIVRHLGGVVYICQRNAAISADTTQVPGKSCSAFSFARHI